MAKNYLENEKLMQELALSHERDRVTEELGSMFLLLASHVARTKVYGNPQDRDDAIGRAVLEMCKHWRSFDMSRGNPFAYFTRAAYNGLALGWNKQNPKHHKRNISLSTDVGKFL